MTEQAPENLQPAWFHHAPFGLLVIDAHGRITYANRALEGLVGLPASELLGHNCESLPSPTHRVLFGADGDVHLIGPGAPERWLHCQVHAAAEATVRYFIDITREQALEAENLELRERLDATRSTDALTGLPNRRAINQHLELHVSRSRRYGNELSLALVQMSLSLPDASIHREAHDPALLAVSRHLRDRLRWVDQIARWDDETFLIILPETDAATAGDLLDGIAGDVDQLVLPELLRHADVELSVGVVGWQKGDDPLSMVQRSEQLIRPSLASSA